MRIACVCPTYKRPLLLGRAIHCFLQQSYTDCELLVLDDAGQYRFQEHERWRLVSVPTRYRSLAAKRQAAVEMVSGADAVLCWDDDDVYFPGAVAAVAEALEHGPYAMCHVIYETAGPETLAATIAYDVSRGADASPRYWGYGGCWAYRLKEFRELGGYPQDMSACNDDIDLATRFFEHFGPAQDSTPDNVPWYWYNRMPGVSKVCHDGPDFWEKRGRLPFEPMESPPIGWNGPDLYTWTIAKGIQPRPF